ncbi:MAG TPA: hypothetical protein VHA57_00770, partial [Actinomycetota bacterium]|nr:hypothetical protein [Actinomycetota bacterium]
RFAAADAVVAISTPATWRARRSWAARRTALAWTVPGAWRLVRAVSGVRLAPATPEGPSPVEVVGGIAPAPVLVVHGTADPFFPAAEAEALCAAAGAPKALWLLDGGGHADALFSPAGILWRPKGGSGSFSATERDPPPGTTGAFVDGLMARQGDLRRAGGPGGGNPQPPAA